MDEINILDILKMLDNQFSYEKICEFSPKQKREYVKLLNELIRVNKINRGCESPTNLNHIKGKALEDIASYLIKTTGDIFEVHRNLRTSTNEIDQLFKLKQSGKTLLKHGLINELFDGFLGECKNYDKTISVTYIGKFCSLLLTNKVKLGILFSYHRVSGKGWSNGSGLIKKFHLHKEDIKERYCIIDFNIHDFRAIEQGYNFLQIIDDKLTSLQLDTDFYRFITKHPAEC